MSKKSGLPKDDYPAFEYSQEIARTKEAKFCMVGKTNVNTTVGIYAKNKATESHNSSMNENLFSNPKNISQNKAPKKSKGLCDSCCPKNDTNDRNSTQNDLHNQINRPLIEN